MLRGENVILTEIRSDDSKTLYNWINDAETVRWNAPYVPVTTAQHAAWFDRLGTDPSRVVFAVRKTSDGPAIGVIQLIDIHRVHRSAELTIRIGDERYQGKGLGTEAIGLATRFAFDDMNLQRLWLRVFHTNGRAIKAYQNAGFEIEGTLRRAAFIKGCWLDMVVMANLRGGNGPSNLTGSVA